MRQPAKSRADALFTATQKKEKQALKEREKARQKDAEQVARLRALRLAKEAADKESAGKSETEGPSTVRLPQAHRR